MGHPMRRYGFVADSLRPMIDYYVRPQGRPRQDFTSCLLERGAELRRSRRKFEQELQLRTTNKLEMVRVE